VTSAVFALYALVVVLGGPATVGHLKHSFAGVNCARCHEQFVPGEDRANLHLPSNATCISCHEQRPATCTTPDCASCHVNEDTPNSLTNMRQALTFNHANHLPRVEGDCVRCHRGAAVADESGRGAMPVMEDCRGCHAEWLDGLACTKCHVSLAAYPVVPITHQAHRPGFINEHGRLFERGSDRCSQCHGQTFCRDCHDRRSPLPPDYLFPDRPDRAPLHRMGYRETHATDARLWPDTCVGCHAPKDCDACHTRAGFGSEGRMPHPQGYAGLDHARDANRDLLTCASCHTGPGADICVTCHAVGRPGGSPHDGRNPNGDKGKRPCRECHGGAR
jgi:hypothetical protein